MEKDLRNYIIKLNDRNIQRQREKGFTIYAMLGIVVFCGYFLIEKMSIYNIILENLDYLKLINCIANSLFILSLLAIAFRIKTRNQKSTKVFPFRDPVQMDLSDIPILLMASTVCVCNFYLISKSQSCLETIYLIIFGTLVALNTLTPFVASMIKLRVLNRKKKRGDSVEILDFTMVNDKASINMFRGLLIYSFLLLTLSIFTITSLKLSLSADLTPITTEYTLVFFGFFASIKMVMDLSSIQSANSELEEFEKEIFFENLTDEEIEERFENEFDGVPFKKWLAERQHRVSGFFETKSYELFNANLLINEVDRIDKTKMPYEYNGRLETVIVEQARLLAETKNFVNVTSNVFNNLKNFASLNKDELNELNYVRSLFQNHIDSFNNHYFTLSQKIAERQLS